MGTKKRPWLFGILAITGKMSQSGSFVHSDISKRMETDIWSILSKKESRKKWGKTHFPKSSPCTERYKKTSWVGKDGWKLQEGSQVNYTHHLYRDLVMFLMGISKHRCLIQNLLLLRGELPGDLRYRGPGGGLCPQTQQPLGYWIVCGCHPASGESSSWGGWRTASCPWDGLILQSSCHWQWVSVGLTAARSTCQMCVDKCNFHRVKPLCFSHCQN